MSPEKLMTVEKIERGTVIDHIPAAVTLKVVQLISGIEDLVTIGVNFPSRRLGLKGVVKIANKELTPEEYSKIALIAPSATVNIIEGFQVKRKTPVKLPGVLEGIVRCPNPSCITNHEPVRTRFRVLPPDGARLLCHYCEHPAPREEVEII